MRKLSIFLLAALSSSSVAPMSGCILSCTDMGCFGILTLTIPVALEDGTYDLDVVGDTFEAEGRFEVLEGLATVDESSPYLRLVDVTEDGLVAELYSGMVDEPDPVLSIVLSDADGEVISEGEAEPAWNDPYYPNGKRCGDSCQSGSVTLEL